MQPNTSSSSNNIRYLEFCSSIQKSTWLQQLALGRSRLLSVDKLDTVERWVHGLAVLRAKVDAVNTLWQAKLQILHHQCSSNGQLKQQQRQTLGGSNTHTHIHRTLHGMGAHSHLLFCKLDANALSYTHSKGHQITLQLATLLVVKGDEQRVKS